MRKGDPRLLIRNDYSNGYPDRKLNGTGLHYLIFLKNLTELSLDKQFLGDNASVLGNLISLVKLSLKDTFLTERSIVLFGNLTNLEELNLSYNNIGTGTRHLASLVQLRTLNLTDNSINDEAFSHLVGLRNLENLRCLGICYCELTPRSIPNIVTFVQTSKVKEFSIKPVFSSRRERQKKINEENSALTYDSDREYREIIRKRLIWWERQVVWEQEDVRTLLEQLPQGFPIEIYSDKGSLTNPGHSSSGGSNCCEVS